MLTWLIFANFSCVAVSVLPSVLQIYLPSPRQNLNSLNSPATRYFPFRVYIETFLLKKFKRQKMEQNYMYLFFTIFLFIICETCQCFSKKKLKKAKRDRSQLLGTRNEKAG